MILLIHLLIGNIFFISFLLMRNALVLYYLRCTSIFKINQALSANKTVKKENSEATILKPASFTFWSFLVFYIQFVTIAWMLFLTTFLAAEIILKRNPKIKEFL